MYANFKSSLLLLVVIFSAILSANAEVPQAFKGLARNYMRPKINENLEALKEQCSVSNGLSRRKMTSAGSGLPGCVWVCVNIQGKSQEECERDCAPKEDNNDDDKYTNDDKDDDHKYDDDNDDTTDDENDDVGENENDDKKADDTSIKEGCNPVVYEMLSEGFRTYSSLLKVQNFKGLQDQVYPQFLDTYIKYANELTMEEKKIWTKNLESILETDEKPHLYTTIGCSADSKCTFNLAMGQHYEATSKSDMYLLKYTMEFKFAPNIYIIRETTSSQNGEFTETKDVVVEVEKTPMDEIDQLLMFMEIIAFDFIVGGGDAKPLALKKYLR